MRKDIPYKLYDIIPSQQTMYFLLKYSIHKQVVQIPLCVTVRENLDIDILKKAFVEEIKRNDALRIRFVKADKQIKQYFLPEYVPEDIPVMHFGSIALRDEYFQNDAEKPVKLFKSVPYRFVIFTLPDGSKIPCAVTQGMIDVSAARVRVLCDSALHPDEINAEAERKQAEAAALKLREKLGHRDYVLSKLAFVKATNHLRVKQHNS